MSQKENQQGEQERTPNNRTTTGFRISDALWAVLQPLLPVHVNTHRFGGGRPRVPDRDCADAIFYILRTGCQWQALDQTELCAHSTAHDRFQIWVEAGVFLNLWQAGVKQFDELCGIEWDWLAMNGAMTKAPLGGEKTGPNPTDRGKSGVKRSLLTEGHGVPIGLVVEGANRHDMKLVRATIESLVVVRPDPTKERPQGMCPRLAGTITMRSTPSCRHSALPLMCALAEKRPGQSNAKPGLGRVGGWWSEHTRG